MPSFDSENHSVKDRFKDQPANENLVAEQDLLMEQILENINTTPIGQVLKKIATLPEVRKKKVLDVRQQLSKGKYRLNERLDIALDRVLEDLTT
jgi:predicted XRE-type DNA-binding protein